MQLAFGKTLQKALKSDPEVRAFLKKESIKMFDKDYDVLYQMVKDQPINNGKTLHQRLAQYSESNTELDNIERQLPLLTIFVPTLPSGFSANTWKTETESPAVAIRNLNESGVPLYDENGVLSRLPSDLTPGFPVVVIKQNERVSLVRDSDLGTSNTQPAFYSNQSRSFRFSSPTYDGLSQSPTPANRTALPPGYEGDERIIGQPCIYAFELAQANPNLLWQRDYVYYGLTPTNVRGPLKTNFRETIRSFKLSNAGINQIASRPQTPVDVDPNNPTVGSSSRYTSTWTDGYFEFQIIVLYNAKDGSGDQTKVDFAATPTDLYDITYRVSGFGSLTTYTITSVTPKEIYPNIPIATWDLQNFGTAWKYRIYEKNTDTDVSTKSSVSTTYAANFEINASGNIGVVKVGGKFGASASTTTSKDITLTYKLSSTDLGEKVSYFYDPIIVSSGATWYGGLSYNTYELAPGGSFGYVFMSVEPWSLIQNENYVN